MTRIPQIVAGSVGVAAFGSGLVGSVLAVRAHAAQDNTQDRSTDLARFGNVTVYAVNGKRVDVDAKAAVATTVVGAMLGAKLVVRAMQPTDAVSEGKHVARSMKPRIAGGSGLTMAVVGAALLGGAIGSGMGAFMAHRALRDTNSFS